MSNAIFNRVRHAQVTASQKIILLLLADYADDTGCTSHYAPIERMAFESCLTERTVMTVIKQLEEAKIIHAHRVTGASSVYYINPDFQPEMRQSIKGNPFARNTTPEIDNTGCAVNFTPETVSPLKLTTENCSQFHPTPENDCKKMSSISPIPSIPSIPSNNHQDASDQKPKAKREKFDPLNVELPAGINQSVWAEFVAMRKDIKKPLSTDRAVNGIFNQLAKCSDKNASLQQSIDHCWQGVFEVKGGYNQNNPHPQQPALQNAVYVPPAAPAASTHSQRVSPDAIKKLMESLK